MAENTGISWCDSTFNPWLGCTKVGPGCNSCYAETWAQRFGNGDLWTGRRQRTKTWGDPLKWQAEAPDWYALHGRRRRVFSASLADIFDNAVDETWRDDFWALVAKCNAMDWYIVTKRVSNIEDMIPEELGWTKERFGHVVIIITVVNQVEANRDIPRLMEIKARNPWMRVGLSIEPMLGAIDLDAVYLSTQYSHWVDWVIAGGESGKLARPMHPVWLRALYRHCEAAGVPFHFKQHGEFTYEVPGNFHGKPDMYVCTDGRTGTEDCAIADGGSWTGVFRFGKEKTGRELDGVIYDQFPNAESDLDRLERTIAGQKWQGLT